MYLYNPGIKILFLVNINYSFKFILFIFFLLFSTSGYAGSVTSKDHPIPCKIQHPSDSKIKWECRRLQKGKKLEDLFGSRWIDVLRFNRIDRRHAYIETFLKVPKRLEDITDFTPIPKEYPSVKEEPKFILVDLSEQFLGAYEYGNLVFSAPITTGEKGNETPGGEFRITAIDKNHKSSLYLIEDTDIPYPMNYGLMFHVTRGGITYWIHGRDILGYPASHGCIGLYDEEMQKKYYGFPKDPVLEDAKRLYEWVISPMADNGRYRILKDGPRVLIVGQAPGAKTPSLAQESKP